MYTPADRSQLQARAVKQGTYTLADTDQEVIDWIKKEFRVNALHFSFETRKQQQLVHLILETADEVRTMQSNSTRNAPIAERFSKYFNFTDPVPEIIVTYRPLKDLDGNIISEILDDEKRGVLKSFDSVWTISMDVIFYFTDAQLKENQANGISKQISDALYQVTTRYGIGPGSPYRFDSKECFDRDYESNWYYYWK